MYKKEIINKIYLKGYYGDYFIVLIAKCKALKKNILEIPFIEKDRASGNSKTTGNKFDLIIKCFLFYSFTQKFNYQIYLIFFSQKYNKSFDYRFDTYFFVIFSCNKIFISVHCINTFIFLTYFFYM